MSLDSPLTGTDAARLARFFGIDTDSLSGRALLRLATDGVPLSMEEIVVENDAPSVLPPPIAAPEREPRAEAPPPDPAVTAAVRLALAKPTSASPSAVHWEQ